MFVYSFSVDSGLRISSWDENLANSRSRVFSEMVGAPYYHHFPRILQDDQDVVAQVILEGKPLTLYSHKIPCFLGINTADFVIEPIRTGSLVTGARITTTVNSDCMLSQQMLEIGKISTTLAHGIRNPLNAIKGAVVYLNEKYKSEAILKEFTQIIEEEIIKLDSFVTRFLSSSLMDLDIDDCDLNAVLDTIVTLTDLQAQSKNIRFIREHDEIPPLKLDKFHIQNAILNIINNAIEAMPGGGEISLRSGVCLSNGSQYAFVKITDTGPGMHDSRLGKHGKQLNGQKSLVGKGFGLSITREIVQRHGGFLEFNSGKGTGTMATIYLPVAKN